MKFKLVYSLLMFFVLQIHIVSCGFGSANLIAFCYRHCQHYDACLLEGLMVKGLTESLVSCYNYNVQRIKLRNQ